MTNQIKKGSRALGTVAAYLRLRSLKSLAVACYLGTLLSAVSANAITLSPPPAPDIFVSGIEMQYVGTSFFARGVTSGGDVFLLNADLTSGGLNSGAFEIGSLIKGALDSFSVDALGSTLEFYFTVTDGTMKDLFGAHGGINLSGILPEFNGFTTDFDNTGGFGIDPLGPAGMGKAYADVGSVPDTGSTLLLSFAALLPLYLFRARMQTIPESRQ